MALYVVAAHNDWLGAWLNAKYRWLLGVIP